MRKIEFKRLKTEKLGTKVFNDQAITKMLRCILIAGLCLVLYPSVSDYYNSFHQTRVVERYAKDIAAMNEDEYQKILDSARSYNEHITENGINWIFSDEERAAYEKELSIGSNGIMGYIKIPKLNIMLPIYHGTSDPVLQTSIGHLEQTSLPVGGEGTHCSLSGHRGLPSARLFTDIDLLMEGDTFNLMILNETLTYEVDQIRIVDPDDLTELRIIPGEDYCTLITCTPYRINTHRLLVRGHRVSNANGNAKVIADAIIIRPVYVAPFLGVPMIIVWLIAGEIERKRRLQGKSIRSWRLLKKAIRWKNTQEKEPGDT